MSTSDEGRGRVRAIAYTPTHPLIPRSEQWTAILAECACRGWDSSHSETDPQLGRDRPGLERAMTRCDGGEFDVLVVASADCAFTSVLDLHRIADRAHRNGWALRVLDPSVDMTSPEGARWASLAGQWVTIGEHIVSGRISAGIARSGRQGGNPPAVDEHAARRILELDAEDVSARGIARRLTLEGFRPPQAQAWNHMTVLAVLVRAGRRGVPHAAPPASLTRS